VSTPKMKIEAKPFVSDLRNGMGDTELMEKYALSENQLHKVFQKLVDAGSIDEMELFMRTSLSDSTITKAFVETQCAVEELGDIEEVTPPRRLETPTDTSITDKVNTITGKILGSIFSKSKGIGS